MILFYRRRSQWQRVRVLCVVIDLIAWWTLVGVSATECAELYSNEMRPMAPYGYPECSSPNANLPALTHDYNLPCFSADCPAKWCTITTRWRNMRHMTVVIRCDIITQTPAAGITFSMGSWCIYAPSPTMPKPAASRRPKGSPRLAGQCIIGPPARLHILQGLSGTRQLGPSVPKPGEAAQMTLSSLRVRSFSPIHGSNGRKVEASSANGCTALPSRLLHCDP